MLIKVHGYFAIMIDKMGNLQNITISSSFGSFVDFSDRKHRNDIDSMWGLGLWRRIILAILKINIC